MRTFYSRVKFETYLFRPEELKNITYPDLYKWWRQILPHEKKSAVAKMETQQSQAMAVSDHSDKEEDDTGDYNEYFYYYY